jgi:hydroxypyruvate reductase
VARPPSPCAARAAADAAREFLLLLAIELDGLPGTWALACDTDGIDGSEDNAGAILAPTPRARRREGPRAAGLAGRQRRLRLLHRPLGELVVTGPTRTNVNDFRVILVE